MTPDHDRIARNSLLLASAPKPVVDTLLDRAVLTQIAREFSCAFSQDGPGLGGSSFSLGTRA